MNYFLLNAFFLAAALIVFVVSIVRKLVSQPASKPVSQPASKPGNGPLGVRLHLTALGITLVVLLVTTLIFDNLIIASGIVAYHVEKLSGLYIGVVPIEDLSYSVAAVLLLPALWRMTDRRKPAHPISQTSGVARED